MRASPGASIGAWIYEADLGAGLNYVPPARVQFTLWSEDMDATHINVEFYDFVNTAWMGGIITGGSNMFPMFQPDSPRWRIINDDVGPISFTASGWRV